MVVSEKMWDDLIKKDASNFDLVCAKKTFFNRRKEDIAKDFSNNVIERCDELRHMPDVLFNQYFIFFIDFVMTYEHEEFYRAEVADTFTALLLEKLLSNSIDSQGLIKSSTIAVDFLKDKLDYFNTDPDIYGDLNKKLEILLAKLKE
ncbi:hypothetical protein A1L58_18115 [Shewanella baltica]|uniref:hypothetical protein n=1 Tax=Shewanella baltica TaxID=62322 RepID=UPI0007B49AF8|nr:hypothetical protein [Shewanella baltica]KZK68669.1 hypothetical protein A1L58_18115 [Shewanella baltica]